MTGAMMSESGSPCPYCRGARLVGWGDAGPLLCPECSAGKDAFQAISGAWREKIQRVRELEGYIERLHRQLDAFSGIYRRNRELEDQLDALAFRLESLMIATAPGMETHLDHELDEARALLERLGRH